MAEPVILQLETEQGIVELPVLEGDTMESLSEALRKNNFDPSKFQNELGQALSGDFGDGLGDSADAEAQFRTQRLAEIDDELDFLREQASSTSNKNTLNILGKKIDILETEKKGFQAPTKSKAQAKQEGLEGVINALLPQFARLQDIETTSGGPLSVVNRVVQNIGSSLDLNPELTAFETAQEGLKIPILKNLLGEVGQTAEQEQLAAKALVFPSGTALFSKETRPEALENAFTAIKGVSGVDIKEELEKSDPGILQKIGAFPIGESIGTGDVSAITGPSVTASEGAEQVLNTVLKSIGLGGGAPEGTAPPVATDPAATSRSDRINRLRQRTR
jgi:hypothetical protein